MTEPIPYFVLWHELVREGGLAVISAYEKYKGGLSPRDVQALTRVLTCLARHNPPSPLEAKSFLAFEPKDWDNHLILIGGLLSNQVTRAMTQDSLRKTQGTFILQREMIRDIRRSAGRDCLTPDYESGLETNVLGTAIDYGLITVQPNPMNRSRRLYLLAGIKGWGGLAAAVVFSDPSYYQPLNQLFDQHFGMSLEDVEKCPLLEIVIRTEIGRTDANGHQDLKHVSVELVRVNGDTKSQWMPIKSRLQWNSRPHTSEQLEDARFPSHLSLSINERVATLEPLRGAAFAARFAESDLTLRDLEKFEYDVDAALSRSDWRAGARSIADRLAEKLPSGFAELLQRMQSSNAQPGLSSIRFVTPREYIRAPFEFLRSERGYLALEYPLLRSISNALTDRPGLSLAFIEDLKVRRLPLKVLMIASDPIGNIAMDVKHEVEHITEIFGRMESILNIQIDTNVVLPEDATTSRLQRILQDSTYHILHFAGHSSWNSPDPERSALYVLDNRNQPYALPAVQIATWVQNSSLRFCYLSSCEGVRNAGEQRLRDEFLGLADALIQVGVPEILGFRWPVPSEGALRFAQVFYQELLGKAALNTERALLRARQNIGQNLDDITWLLAILISQK